MKYTYSLYSKSKFPLYGHQNHTPLCDIVPRNASDNAPSKLFNWFRAIDEISTPKKAYNNVGDIATAPEILWQLKPTLEEPDRNKATKLIADIVINLRNKSMTARILGSPPVEITFTGAFLKIDRNNILNGINDISVVEKYRHLIPKDNTLGWSPIRIIGMFSHGDLNGLTVVETNVSTYAWMTVNHCILHGPAIIYGISHILEPVSKITIHNNVEMA